MKMEQQPYSGVENLEVMSEARNYNDYLLRTVRSHARPGDRILDFGAGGGQFAVPLSNAGLDVTALEPDGALRNRIAARGVATVANLDAIQDESLDYIYTLNVLEHIEDDTGTLRQLHSKLTRNGTLLVYVPAFPVLYSSMDAKVGHVRRYKRSTLDTAVGSAGFSIRRAAYVDSLGFFAALLFKAVGNRDGAMNVHALKLYDRLLFPISRLTDTITGQWFGKNLLVVATKR